MIFLTGPIRAPGARPHRAAGLVTREERKRHIWRVDSATAVSVFGGYGTPGTPAHFSPGNPTVGQRGTIPGADWFEDKQEELIAIATAAGIAPQKGNTKQLAQAILAMTVFTDTGAGGANALVVTPPVAFDTLNTNTVLWIVPQNSNTGPATLNIGVGGNVALVRPDGATLQPNDYTALQPFQVAYLGGAWKMLRRRTRWLLGQGLTLSVNASSGNDATGGFSTAFQTLQGMWNWLAANVDLNGFVVTVNCAGSFSAGLSASGALVGQAGPTSVVLNFAAGATVSVASGSCFIATYGAMYTVQGLLTMTASGTGANQGYGILTVNGGQISLGAGPTFGACATADIAAGIGGAINLTGSYTDGGNSPYHLLAQQNGAINANSAITVTLSGSPVHSSAFAAASGGGANINISNSVVTFSGAAGATTPRWSATLNGVINTNGATLNTYIPGTTNGAAATGGQTA